MRTDTRLHPKLEQFIRDSNAVGASDIFLVPGEPLTRRVGGQITRTEGEVLTAQEITEIAAAALGDEQLARIGPELPEMHRSFSLEGEMLVQVRVARSYAQYTIAVQLSAPVVMSVESLRVPDAILKAALSPSGLIVFSGLIGSGKTTTAYSVVDYINEHVPCHICTAEDPMFVRLTPKKAMVQQREIGADIADMVAGVRAAKAQDVDVLYLAEVKTMEEYVACLATAETGHLVITVLHLAATPQELIRRMIDAFPPDERSTIAKVLAKSLRAVCCQTLLPTTNGRRVAAYAVMVPDQEMRTAIAEGRELMRREEPMPPECQTMSESIQSLLDQGLITAETAEKALAEIE